MVNPANPFVADAHLRCAAHEKPLTHADERYWPGLLDEVVLRLALDDQVVRARAGPGSRPAGAVRRRGLAGARRRAAGRLGRPGRAAHRGGRARGHGRAGPGLRAGATRAPRTSTPGSRGGWSTLDLDGREAIVEPDDGATYTVPRSDVEIRVVSCDARRRSGRIEVGLGTVEVHQQVTGYQRKEAMSRRVARGHAPRPAAGRRSTPGRSGTWCRRPCWTAAGVDRADAPARCTPPSTRASACCRCSPSATAGTSAGCRRCTRPTWVARPS